MKARLRYSHERGSWFPCPIPDGVPRTLVFIEALFKIGERRLRALRHRSEHGNPESLNEYLALEAAVCDSILGCLFGAPQDGAYRARYEGLASELGLRNQLRPDLMRPHVPQRRRSVKARTRA